MKIKNILLSVLTLFTILFSAAVHSRDIDVDAIYLKKESALYKKLISLKFDAYAEAGSLLTEKGVIFSGWSGGDEIAFITERGAVNILSLYSTRTHRSKEICRITGTVTAFRSGSGGSVFLKRISINEGMPSGETLSVNLATGKISQVPGAYPFIDFSLAPDGRSLIVEGSGGISQYYPDSGITRMIIAPAYYSSIKKRSEPVITYVSPDRGSRLIISGSGGSYRSLLLREGGNKTTMEGISSAGEAAWIDNSRVIFRRGGAGSYSAVVYDTVKKSEKILLSGSLNTNITFTPEARKGALLDSQLICFYEARDLSLYRTGIEGEDPQISPDGTRVTSLFQGRLFITRIESVKRAEAGLKKNAAAVTALYTEALTRKADHENSYSVSYIQTKIAAYKRFTGR